MYLDAVKTNGKPFSDGHTNGNGFHFSDRIFSPWKNWQPSEISHHGRSCCETAREWLFNTDMSTLNGGSLFSGPRWLRQRFEWGPGTYPVYWCDVIKKQALDCGVHAALAFEIFTNRGLKCYRAQFVQEFSSEAGSQWRSNWEKDSAITNWIDEERIYHEGCALLIKDNSIKIWDPSAGWWVDPKTVKGYGSILALRITSNEQIDGVQWDSHHLKANVWTCLGNASNFPEPVESGSLAV